MSVAALLLMQGGLASFAQQYQSKLLAKMAAGLPLSMAEAGNTPGYHDLGAYNGRPISVCADANGCINHIGLKLFAPEIKTLYPSAVYDFLERYFLELSMISNVNDFEQKLKEDKVHLLTGSLQTVKSITPETPFNIDRVDDKGYSVRWSVDDKEILNVMFPIEFELLLGMPKVEIEKQMQGMLKAAGNLAQVPPFVMPDMEDMGDGMRRSIPSSFYELESLNTTSYYTLNAGAPVPYFASEHKDYAAANLFLTDVARNKNYRLYVEQSLYGGEKSTYTIPFLDWLNYCASQKLDVYFGVEEEREDGLKVLVIARNHDLGYNHMLSVVIPDNFVDKADATLKAKFNAFIPTQNVKTLYGKYTIGNKKKI